MATSIVDYQPFAMCPPAVRTVAIQVRAERDDDCNWIENDHEILPVVALLASRSEVGDVHVDPMILDPDGDCQRAWYVLDRPSTAYEIVACPWPADEDAERLKPIIMRLRAGVRAESVRRNMMAAESVRRHMGGEDASAITLRSPVTAQH